MRLQTADGARMPTEIPPENNRIVRSPDEPELPPTRPKGSPQEGGGALHIATIAGIPIRLHFSFLLLLAWLAFVSIGNDANPARTDRPPWAGLLFVIAIFACVLLHELGHALVAQRYGIRTRDIVLYPIGGIASLETMPRPRQELWIALAGPAVNLLIAGILYLVLRATNQPLGSLRLEGFGRNFIASILWANLTLCAFNMIPAFPMDGGRVLRAIIARFTSEVIATAIAARIGQFIALLFGLYGLLNGPLLLILVAIFVYMGAGQEAAAFQAKALVEGHRVREAMLREFRTLSVGDTLRDAADALLAGSQQDFPVVHGGEVVGVLSRSALMRGMASEGPEAYVAGVMERDFAWIQPDEHLDTLLTQMQQVGPILVMEGETPETAKLVGMITQENLLEFLTLTQLQMRRNPPNKETRG